jgi:hypothetical protein
MPRCEAEPPLRALTALKVNPSRFLDPYGGGFLLARGTL